MEEAYVIWHFSIVLISLIVEVAQISDFLVHAKIFRLKFTTLYAGQERHSSHFFIS